MKKLYFLLFTILISAVSFGQTTIDFETEENWSPSPNGYGNYTYTEGSFTATGVDVLRNGSSTQDGFPGALDSFSVRLRNNLSTSLTMIISSGGVSTFSFQVRRWDGNPATNFAVETTTDNGANWSASSVIDATVTDDSDWKTVNGTINSANTNVGVRIISQGTTERIMVDNFTWTGFTTSCGVTLGTAVVTCDDNTLSTDDVIISIPYTGADNGISSVTSSNMSASIGGDNPAVTSNGTIIIGGLTEGDSWDVILNGGDCDGISASGTVDATFCDPIPNTCFDLSNGTENFELVPVTLNSQNDTWTFNSGTYAMNGFCGSGCQEQSETWLIFGPLDFSSSLQVNLFFDASESFGVTDLNIAYTEMYTNCPSTTSWTTVGTVTDAGAINIDLAALSGLQDVFIGIEYNDDGADNYSSWFLSNVELVSYDTCPTLGARPTSDCSVCDLALQTESYICLANTENVDPVTVSVPYTGLENTITSVTTTTPGAVIGGDDPSTTADGTIEITGLSEGDSWDLTINGGDCDGTTISGTIPATNCEPATIIINEIHADPASGLDGDANGDGTRDFSDDEFIEFYNLSGNTIDISNYTIETGGNLRHTFASGTVLDAGDYIVVFGGGTVTNRANTNVTASTGGLSLGNSGTTITLKDGGGITVAEETYGSEGGNDQSIARDPDFTGPFVQHLSIAGNPVRFSPGAGNALSTNDFDRNSFSIYPNPTNTGEVTISTLNSTPINVVVYDILGKQVQSETISNNTLNVSNLRSGIYVLRLEQDGATTTKKLVIE